MFERKPSQIPVNQSHINSQLAKFCKKYQKKYEYSEFTDEFIAKINGGGQCSGYAARFLLGIKLEEEKQKGAKKDNAEKKLNRPPRDDLTNFRHMLEVVSTWNGTSVLSPTAEKIFYTLVYQLFYLHNPYAFFPIAQPDLDKFVYDSGNRNLKREFCFGGCETLDTFEQLLVETIKPGLLNLLTSKHHTIAIYQNASGFVFYDSNYRRGWIALPTLSEVAQHCFQSWKHDPDRRSSVELHIFSYQKKGEEKAEKISFPSHKALLEKFHSEEKFKGDRNYDQAATPLWVAAKAGDTASVKFYLDHNHNPNEAVELRANPLFDSAPLLVAAEMGRLDVVNALLSCPRTNLNIMDDKGNSPLYKAVSHGHFAVVERLLAEKNLDINMEQKSDGATVIHEAVRCENHEMVKLLLHKGEGLDIHKPLYSTSRSLFCCFPCTLPITALRYAILFEHWKCAIWLLIYSHPSQLHAEDKRMLNAPESKKKIIEDFFYIVNHLESKEEKRSILKSIESRSNALAAILNPEIPPEYKKTESKKSEVKSSKIVPEEIAVLEKQPETVVQRIKREYKEILEDKSERFNNAI